MRVQKILAEIIASGILPLIMGAHLLSITNDVVTAFISCCMVILGLVMGCIYLRSSSESPQSGEA